MPRIRPSIEVRYIPHEEQRYDTAGDWWFDDRGALHVRVSRMPDQRMMEAVALHEQMEALLCRAAGIDEKLVSQFDIEYEAKRARTNIDEPGDDPSAPYHKQHQAATLMEMLYLRNAGVPWYAHEKSVNNLPEWKPRGGRL